MSNKPPRSAQQVVSKTWVVQEKSQVNGDVPTSTVEAGKTPFKQHNIIVWRRHAIFNLASVEQ